MSLSAIGSVKSNLQKISTETTSNYDRLRREATEAKFYYLHDSHTAEEFEYVVNAELRRGTTGEFGLPAKELFNRLGDRFRKIFRKKEITTKTVYEHIYVPMSDEEIRRQAVGAARHMYFTQQASAAAENQRAQDQQAQSVAAAKAAWPKQALRR